MVASLLELREMRKMREEFDVSSSIGDFDKMPWALKEFSLSFGGFRGQVLNQETKFYLVLSRHIHGSHPHVCNLHTSLHDLHGWLSQEPKFSHCV